MNKTVVYVITLFLSVNGICFAGNTKKEDKTMKNQKIVQTAGDGLHLNLLILMMIFCLGKIGTTKI